MKKIDLTLPLTEEVFKFTESVASKHKHIRKADLFGHIGTHLDLIGKTYPDDYFRLAGRVFDVKSVAGRDIDVNDVDLNSINEKDFVFFHSGCLKSLSYTSKEYISDPIQLSWELIQALIDKKAAMIGIDFAGIRYHKEHREADILCAENGVFVVENLYELDKLTAEAGRNEFTVHCYPMRLTDATGLPCRVIAEIQ